MEAGRISAVIPEASAERCIGSETRVVQLNGALLAPGFQDAHVHPMGAGVELLQCNLTESENADEAVATVEAYARANPDEPWILGGGWSMDHFPGGAPARGLLDEILPDRPVFLMSRDHHSAWVNTAAMRLAGLSELTEDPKYGRIEREADGFPARTFHEGAGNMFDGVKPLTNSELAYRGLMRAQDELLALGITGWQYAWVGPAGVGASSSDVYLRALDEGTLKVHVVGSQWWERNEGLEQIDAMLRTRRSRSARRTRCDRGGS